MIAVLLAAKGGGVQDLTFGDLLAMRQYTWAAGRRSLNLAYSWLRAAGVVPFEAPATLRDVEIRSGQVSVERLVDRYQLKWRPVRDVIVDYIAASDNRPSITVRWRGSHGCSLPNSGPTLSAITLESTPWHWLRRSWQPGKPAFWITRSRSSSWKSRNRHVGIIATLSAGSPPPFRRSGCGSSGGRSAPTHSPRRPDARRPGGRLPPGGSRHQGCGPQLSPGQPGPHRRPR